MIDIGKHVSIAVNFTELKSISFPVTPPRRQQIHVHNEDMGRLREIFLQPPQRATFQTNTQAPPLVEISKSTAFSKLKKVVHDPPPKRYARRDEDGKTCAICLEDFEPSEEVMLTPCNHMFHKDCIVPWLIKMGNQSSFNNNDIANLEPTNIINREFLSFLRAMEEAFQLGSMTY
uniref:RING-type domain-containing protein n=1 Tax=Glycine max TaxID=3847 RepID=A0A0R0F7B1_SOYBN